MPVPRRKRTAPAQGKGFEDVKLGRMVLGPHGEPYVELGLEPILPVEGIDPLIVNIDGCSKGNPGPAAIGVAFSAPDGDPVAEGCAPLGRMTNNAAEYHALIAALSQALAWAARRVEVRTDSELLARQMDGNYSVKSPLLLPLVKMARELRGALEYCRIRHVPREQNRRADRLANLALERS